ncbi:MAG: glycosyltransferase family 2 protein, partial [Pedobacter sp.]
MLKKVAVVILNWNGKQLLEQFLPTVLSSSYANLEIIIVDNASTDNSVQFIESKYPSLRIIKHTQNHGFAKGYNLALKQIEADYYVLLNSDVEVTTNWIEPIIEVMEADENIAAAQPKIKSQKNKSQFEYAGAAGGFIDMHAYPFCRGRIFDEVENDQGQYNENLEVFWASGAALFIKSKCWHEVNGLDEDFFAHMEEIDLCWRLKNKGYKIIGVMNAEVYHVGGASLEASSPFKTYLNFRNNLIMMQKNLPQGDREMRLIVRFFLDFIAWLRFLFQGKTAFLKAISKAHYHFLRDWTKNSVKMNNQAKPFLQHKGVYKHSIIIA